MTFWKYFHRLRAKHHTLTLCGPNDQGEKHKNKDLFILLILFSPQVKVIT